MRAGRGGRGEAAAAAAGGVAGGLQRGCLAPQLLYLSDHLAAPAWRRGPPPAHPAAWPPGEARGGGRGDDEGVAPGGQGQVPLLAGSHPASQCAKRRLAAAAGAGAGAGAAAAALRHQQRHHTCTGPSRARRHSGRRRMYELSILFTTPCADRRPAARVRCVCVLIPGTHFQPRSPSQRPGRRQPAAQPAIQQPATAQQKQPSQPSQQPSPLFRTVAKSVAVPKLPSFV